MVLFLADHGEEFFEHGGWTHEHSLAEEIVRIPLLVRVPGGTGRGVRVPASVGIEDVLPTLLDLAGVTTPAHLDGRTLAPLLAGAAAAPRPFVGLCRRPRSGTLVRSAVLDGWKILSGTRGPLRVERFYDLARDPGELRPVDAPPPDVGRRLRGLLAEAEAIEEARSLSGRAVISSELRRGLAGLGYLGSPEPK